MKKLTLEQVVLQYEINRQLVKKLNDKRCDLVSQCKNIGPETQFLTCGPTAYSGITDDDSFGDMFYHHINDGNGACEYCLKAIEIKRGPLAAAKKQFGIAKRRLAHHGKIQISQMADGLPIS